jgi:hypothetical protein
MQPPLSWSRHFNLETFVLTQHSIKGSQVSPNDLPPDAEVLVLGANFRA